MKKARWVWEQEHGPIPEGFDIHHKDLNKENDIPSNLEMLLFEEHNDLHSFLRFSKMVDEEIEWFEKEGDDEGQTCNRAYL